MLLAVVTTANAWAQRGKRAIERIDRSVPTLATSSATTWLQVSVLPTIVTILI